MSRQQLLYRLLEKAQQGNQYIYAQFCEMTKLCSPPATIKRMQLLQMGSGKITGPTPKNKEQLLFEKQNSSNNRRIFVLQKVKNTDKKTEMERQKSKIKPIQTLNIQEIPNYVTVSRGQQRDSCSKTDNLKTQAESPLRHGYTGSRNIGHTYPINSTIIDKKDNQTIVKIQKQMIFKSTELKSQSARLQSQLSINRKYVTANGVRQQMSFSTRKQEDKKQKILFRKQVNRNYQRAFQPPPKISAKSYIVYEIVDEITKDLNCFKIHLAFNSKVRAQIASLTKIMTCILAIELCEKFQLDPKTQQIKVGKFESAIAGTTANIQMDDVYTLHDLLHGLMLPSGNDASVAIAVWGGKKLIQHKQILEGKLIHEKKMKKQCYERFIQEMNARAQSLRMSKTTYANSHGLVNLLNRSCAHDVAVLSAHCMNNSYFKSIVSCTSYKNTIRVQNKLKQQSKQIIQKTKIPPKIVNDQDQQLSDFDSQTCSQYSQSQQKENIKQENAEKVVQQQIIVSYRQISWENTHKLLHKYPLQYLGIKTGVTTVAGPCLSSYVLSPCGRKFIIVVLNCKKLAMRFKQTQFLKKWIYKKQGIVKKLKCDEQTKSLKSQVTNLDNDSQSLDQFQNPNDPYD